MTRRIEHIVTLDPDDFEALHTIYTNKGNADPIVNAYRRTLRATTPPGSTPPTAHSPATASKNSSPHSTTATPKQQHSTNTTHYTKCSPPCSSTSIEPPPSRNDPLLPVRLTSNPPQILTRITSPPHQIRLPHTTIQRSTNRHMQRHARLLQLGLRTLVSSESSVQLIHS